MKSLPLFTPLTTSLPNSRHLESTRARMLALFVLVALLGAVAWSAYSNGRARGLFLGTSSRAAAGLEINSSSFARDRVPLSSTVAAYGTLNVARMGHTATVLSDNRVLIVGGENQTGLVTEAELFDPSTGSFSFSGNLNTPRVDHAASRLSDGRVLIAGGRGGFGSLNSTEIFDPTTGVFTAGPDLMHSRVGPSATLQSDGRVLLAGGDGEGTLETFNPGSNSFSLVASLNLPRSFHSAALMQDGRILFVGGSDADGSSLSTGEVFDPTNGTRLSVESVLTVARVRPHLRVLFDGKVQIIGGTDDGSMEIYDPQAGVFGAYVHVQPEGDTCANLPAQVQRSQTRAALFHNGQADVTFDRTRHTVTELTDQAIVIGGFNRHGDSVTSAPRFSSTAAEISTDKLDYSPGETVSVMGRGFAPGETVRIKVHEDPHTPLERGMDVVADPNGDFIAEYLVQNYDLDMRFLVGARGLTSGRTAQTSFTDTDPVAQSLPYSQDFAALPHTGAGSSTYPAGWQGWSVGSTSSTSFKTNAPLADLSLSTNGHAGTTTGGVLNYNGKIGILPSGSIDPSLALAINTTGYTSITVNFDIMTIRNPHDGSGNTRINQADLQYRIGTTGSFTSVSGLANGIYQNNTTTQTTNNVTTPQKLESQNLILPVAANNQSVVQIRWVQRDASGGGSRPGFAVDNISIAGAALCTAPSVTLQPSNQAVTYGDAGVSFTSTASATPSPTVQWQVDTGSGFANLANGENVSGVHTTTLTISDPVVSMSGYQYRAVFTNDCGSVNSAPATLTVSKATPTATLNVTNSPQTYNGSAKSATLGISASSVPGLVANISTGGSATQTNSGIYAVTADFVPDDTANYNSLTGLSAGYFSIDPASSTTVVDCAPGTFVYTGIAQTPCTARVTGVGGLDQDVTPVNYTDNVNVGTAQAQAAYHGDANHLGSNSSANFQITKVTLSVNADHQAKTFGQSEPAPTWTYSGFVTSEGPTPAGLSGSASCSYASHSNDAGTYKGVITCAPGTLSSTNYDFATGSLGNLTISAKDVTVTAENKTRYYGQSDPPFTFAVYGLVSPDTTLPGATCSVTVPHTNAGTHTNAITCWGNTNTNYNVTAYNPGTLTVNPDPTEVTLDNKTSGASFDCLDNKYTATLKDTISNQGLAGVVLKLSIGTQSVTDTTDSNGLAEFTLTLNQPVGTKTESVEYVSGLNANYVVPTTATRNFNVTPDLNLGPGTDATSFYTGSNFFWTTSSTSSTATLTLSATIKDTSEQCVGLITTAKVSFLISTNGTNFSPVPNAQNLPVGLVDPNNRQVGTASAISQYNIGADQSVTLIVRVVVGGQYSFTGPHYDSLITIGKPGATTSLMGGGKIKNDGVPFPASGYLGLNSISAEFGTQVQYNKKGVNPQGQVTVNVKSCNDRFGNQEPDCTKNTPEKWHHYFIKSNSISELSLVGGSASFGSKTNVSEVLSEGSKVGLDGGNTMQLIFTPYNKTAPPGSFVPTSGVIDSNGKCTAPNGCASIVIFRSAGGVWYSSSWGQAPPPATAPRTHVKRVVNGTVVVDGVGS